ncbi:hypothetical protein K7H13_13790 [Qipengyuania citrea]|uniref:hypothetical protein n=1 Tax=Qipengyuania citrea TaxID=225971 RepID=UPI001E2BC0AB|nr:hypothetical protein [Qipengyuania citrea]MCD1591821.1 hypothetical protein [Qipengyuania citrea]
MKVNQMEAAAVFSVSIPLAQLMEDEVYSRLMRNARRRTKTEPAARELAAWKLMGVMNEIVEDCELKKWVDAQDGKATMCRKGSFLNEWKVICHDASTAMLFKLTFCGT